MTRPPAATFHETAAFVNDRIAAAASRKDSSPSPGHRSRDATVDTCHDADRLGLGRVGMRPAPRKMATFAGAALALAANIPPSTLRAWLATRPF